MGGNDKMNVNPIILGLKQIEALANIPVVPDEYEGTEKKYITFTYEDERGVEFGDDKVLADTAYMQINFFTPKKFDYMALKEVIKTYLEEVGIVTSTTSRVYEINNEKIRQTTFTVEITKERN
jgi:hypothetical protein